MNYFVVYLAFSLRDMLSETHEHANAHENGHPPRVCLPRGGSHPAHVPSRIHKATNLKYTQGSPAINNPRFVAGQLQLMKVGGPREALAVNGPRPAGQ